MLSAESRAFILGGIILASVLQILLLLSKLQKDVYTSAEIFLAFLLLFLSTFNWKTKRFGNFLSIFYFGQAGLFFWRLLQMESFWTFRILLAIVAILHGTLLICLLLAFIKIHVPSKFFFVPVAFIFSELFLQVLLPHFPLRPVEWIDKQDPVIYRETDVVRIPYAENPKNYFRGVRGKEIAWLRLGKESAAELISLKTVSDGVRIQIQKTQMKAPYDIQVNFPYLRVQAGTKYVIRFQARADAPRNISVGLAQSHPPWNGLGGYKKFRLTSKWRQFERTFTATADDENARIHFDLAQSPISVELASVFLQTKKGDAVAPRSPTGNYFVEYRFNAMGCRGGEPEENSTQRTERILFLGDGQTFGVALHEEDTFANLLEKSLDTQYGNNRYEVLNCGVSGYGTREERHFYQLFGARYKPKLVVLVVSWNDNGSLVRILQENQSYRLRRMDLLFYSWSKLRERRYPLPDFSENVTEILQLHQLVRTNGARLAVVLFRDDSDYSGRTYHGKIWNEITNTLSGKLKHEKIPLFDLGRAFYSKHSEEDLLLDPVRFPFANSKAHEIAAREILKRLQQAKLLP